MYLGYSVNTTDEAEIQEAYQLIADAVKNGVYQGKVMDEVFQKMEGGNAAIATYYAGDYLSMLENNEDLAYVVPEEGSNWFVDAMCVLKTSQHKEEAEAWINFMASTEANLRNMDYIWYASPNAEALETYPAYYEETYGEDVYKRQIIRDVCPVVKQFFHVFAVSGQIFSFPGRRSVQLSSSRRFCQPVMSMPRMTLRKPSCSRA